MSGSTRRLAARALVLPLIIGATLLAFGAWYACGRPRSPSPSE